MRLRTSEVILEQVKAVGMEWTYFHVRRTSVWRSQDGMLWTECFVFPPKLMLRPSPQYDGIRRWGSWTRLVSSLESRTLEGGHGNPLQYSCLENPHGQRSLVGYSLWGCRVRHSWAIKHSTAQESSKIHCVYWGYTDKLWAPGVEEGPWQNSTTLASWSQTYSLWNCEK